MLPCQRLLLLKAVTVACCMQPLLIIGNISACVTILVLGVAPNYTVAILSRFLGGLFIAGVGV